MQGKLQEKLDQVGSTTRNQIENMRQVWERVSSVENENAGVQSAQLAIGGEKTNPELEHRAQKVSERITENIHIVANEPSLAFYRIQEHVRKSMPMMLEKKHEVQCLHKKVQGNCFDTEYAVNALNSMQASRTHFQSIQDLLKNAMFMKQQIQYEQARRQQSKIKPSMYRGAMMRTQTLDAAISLGDRERRAEFTQSLQLPATTSLHRIEDSTRLRSSSFGSRDVQSSSADSAVDQR